MLEPEHRRQQPARTDLDRRLLHGPWLVDGEVALNKYLMRYLGFALVKVNASDIYELRTLVERLNTSDRFDFACPR